MMLRSSSTPILGSLLPESPSHHRFYLNAAPAATVVHAVGFPSCSFSPSSDHSSSSLGVIRRTRSAGSLHSLLSPDQPHEALPPNPCSSAAARRCKPVLEPIPSFSMHGSKGLELDEEDEEGYYEQEKYEDVDCREFAFGEGAAGNHRKLDAAGGSAVSSLGMGGAVPPLFLARGLGIDRVGSGFFTSGFGGDGDGGKCSVWTGDGGDKSGTEAYYKKMVEEDPSNALILRNYAEFLYQTMGDLKRAEEYYSRAILAAPGDGEILSQYAKLVWELHGDEERATSYFQQAVQAAPNDSHVLAAYAGFLWETEDGEEDGRNHDLIAKPAHDGAFAPAV